MIKDEAKTIAMAMIAHTAKAFDYSSFEDSELSEKDENKVIKEMEIFAKQTFSKLEKKTGIYLNDKCATSEIVNAVLYDKNNRK